MCNNGNGGDPLKMVQVRNGNHATYSDGNLCVHCLAEFQLSLSLPDAMEEPQVMIVTCHGSNLFSDKDR